MDKAPAPRSPAAVDPDTRETILHHLRLAGDGEIPDWLPDAAAVAAYVADVAAMLDAAPAWTEGRYRRIAALLAPYVKFEDDRPAPRRAS